jgi:hypothetical protein
MNSCSFVKSVSAKCAGIYMQMLQGKNPDSLR